MQEILARTSDYSNKWKTSEQSVRLTSQDDVGQSSAAVGVQHVGPHVRWVLQAAMAANQSWQCSLGVVKWGGGRIETRASCCGAHGIFQQRELVQLGGRWKEEWKWPTDKKNPKKPMTCHHDNPELICVISLCFISCISTYQIELLYYNVSVKVHLSSLCRDWSVSTEII